MKTKNILLHLFFFLSFVTSSMAQEHFQQSQSENTYIYKITEDQAFQLFADNPKKLDQTYFKTLVDSFPTPASYQKKLSVGHYIKTNANKNLQQTYYQAIKNMEVFAFNNAKDLIIQVYAYSGEIIENAEVYIDHKKIPFNNEQNAFVDKKSNKKGILTVKHNGFKAYYHLSRTQNSSFLSRSTQKLAYTYPTKYVWLPIEYLAMLPIDGVKSIQDNYASGTIWKTKQFFVNLYENVACWFDIYYCDEDETNYDVAYFVFNKPKFKPNDTLKGKAFIWDEKGKPINTELSLRLRKNYQEFVEVGKIAPYQNGSYNFRLHLHDSLGLDLDKSYSVELLDDENSYLVSNRFMYEEYNLKGINLSLALNSTQQYKGQKLEVNINAKDENELPILDGKIEVQLISIRSDFQAKNYVFVPDTLWTHQMPLSTAETTKFSVPDSIFPDANVAYMLIAKLQTIDQEYVEATEQMQYYHESKKIKHRVVGDSILVEFIQNGKKIAADLQIESLDHFGNRNEIYKETTPFQFQIDPLRKTYLFKIADLEKEVDVNSIATGINAQLYRTKDSVFIKVLNPNQLPFNYHVFKKNKEILSGSGSTLNFSKEEHKLTNYYLTLNYVWAGKVIERNFAVPIYDKKLQLKVNQPRLIYPGQKVNVDLEVLDHKENPVENADVLAYGMTSKFNFTPSNIKTYSTSPKNRKFHNSFQINEIADQSFEEPLQIDKWNTLANLKKLHYYQLIYPEQKIFKHEMQLENQPTQFAPFVVDKGEILPVHIIYKNQKPIYFSDMTNVQPYSFEVDHRPVQIQLRTKNHLITLDSILFKREHKTILSLDVNRKYANVSIKKVSSKLNEYERNRLLQYVMPYQTRNRSFAYVQNSNRFHLLSSSTRMYNSYKFLGPIHNKKITFTQDSQHELGFNLEPYYLYEFKPKHLKQSSFSKTNYPTFLSHNEIPGFYDLVLTENKIELLSELNLMQAKQNYQIFDYLSKTSNNNGTLTVKHKLNPTNIVLTNQDNEEDFRVYKGSATTMYDLKPGTYRLIFIYPNQDYSIQDNINVQANGTNFYSIENLEVRKADSFSDQISNLITNFFIKRGKNKPEFYKQKLKQAYQENMQFMGESHVFSGVVSDEDGLPLPGVNIVVSGTNYGTQSDFDGNFQLRVPKGFQKVEVSYIGFENIFLNVSEDRFQQITLKEDGESLNEVLVVGYGSSTRRSFAGAAQVVQNDMENNAWQNSSVQGLLGQVAGVSVLQGSGQPGHTSVVRIRGNSSLGSNGQPLYVINGVPYDGDALSLAADLIQDVTVLKDSEATAIYGSRGKNGVILITTSQADLQIEEETKLEPDFTIESSDANSIRNNFKDEAFWKPNLTTDENGKVSFSITYPDDVTSWDTHFYVATESQQTGQTSQNVKSYRPLVAQLSIPKYLIEGDSLFGIGKLKNYLKDSIQVETKFSIDEKIQFTKEKQIFDFEADALKIVAKNTDSLQISYQVNRKESDYLDGEELNIPVFAKGMEKAVGEFKKLQQNDTLKLNFDSNLGEAELKIEAGLHQVLEQELEVVINYLHNCNEQIASRLKAQLIKRKIDQHLNRSFEDDKDIKKLIRLLQKNQKPDSLWGWWANSSTNLWASLNVVDALLMAEQQEFKVNWDLEQLKQKLTDRLFLEDQAFTRIQLLQLLDVINADINFKAEIEKLLQNKNLSVVEALQLWELYQKHGGIVPISNLMEFQKESALGHWYIKAEEKHFFHPYKNSVQVSLIAYRILSKMKNQEEASEKMKDYLILKRSFGGYANTFESMQVIETLIDDVSNSANTRVNYQIQVNNSDWQTMDASSLVEIYQASDEVKLVNTSELPIYVNYVQKYVDPRPKKQKDLFEVETHFENEFDEVLQQNEIQVGKPVSLTINLDVKKQANYFMLAVPVPSGLSYHNKKQFRNETHREYAKDKTYIFMESLDAGKHTFQIELMPRFKGSFQLNPAKAMLMYFEHLHGNNEMKTIQVTE